MIAALNHPGICTMHELGEASGRVFLVMEFLEGETLRAHTKLTEGELIDVAVQVTKALEAAHGAGMVHRDIKPDNLFLTKQGVVKLMDFGLAKPLEEEGGAAEQSSVTGTSGYMSPEQSRGEPLDARSDIYSLGKVLEELGPPKKLAPIINKALADDPTRRWQSVREFGDALETVRKKMQPRVVMFAIAAIAVVAVVGLIAWYRVLNQREDFTPVPLVAMPGLIVGSTFSPDGNRVAFDYHSPDGEPDKSGIYIKQVGGGPPVRLTNGKSDYFPSWSPDDHNIVFIRASKVDSILLVPAIGGAPREVAKVVVSGSTLQWSLDSRWLFLSARESPNEPFGIWLLSVETGERRRLLPPLENLPGNSDLSFGDIASSLSPDGRTLVLDRTLATNTYNLYAVSLTPDLRPEGPVRKLTDHAFGEIDGVDWVSQREIIFSDAGLLHRMQASGRGPPRSLNWTQGLAIFPEVSHFKHRLVYVYSRSDDDLWRLDLNGGQYRKIAESNHSQQHPQYSPDARRIAFDSNRSGQWGLTTCDSDGENCQEVTSYGGTIGGSPHWSPDGRWLAFDSRIEGPSQIYVMPAGGGAQRRLTSGDRENLVPSWSRDGRWIYFLSQRSGQWRVWKTPAGGGEPLQVTHSHGGASLESADGQYLYFFAEDTSGLYRMPVGGGEEKQIATNVYTGSFTVTAKGVYFLSDAKTLQLVDEKDDLTRTVARLGEHSVENGITVSPDDAYLLFSVRSNARNDLMLVEGFR